MAYIEDKKPAGLTALTTLATDDVVIVGDTSDASEVVKTITKANLVTDLGSDFHAVDGTDVPVADGGTGASTAADARTNLGVDAAGTDNSTDVTLAGTGTYISIAGQVITVDPITESDISDLGSYITDITGSPLSELSDVTITTIATGEVLKWNGTAWINQTLTEADIFALSSAGALATLDTVSATEIDDEAVTLAKMAHIATNRMLGRATAGTGDVEALTATQARDNIGVGTGDSPQFTGVNVGHATDTTITRVSAGVIAVEGTNVSLAGHTHTASEVTDFDTEVANNSAVTANTAKLTCDTTNVTAAGALMDSEVTNLAQVKAFDTTDYATAAQGTTADSAIQPAVGEDLTDVQAIFVDATPDTDHTATGLTTDTINAGATIAIGELCYLASDGEWALADASATGTADKLLAISVEAGTDGASMEVALPGSFVRDDTWAWTVGARLFMSETAGDLTETAPTTTDSVVRPVGYAISADVVFFQPEAGIIHV